MGKLATYFLFGILLATFVVYQHGFLVKFTDNMKHRFIADGRYKCCLVNPCTECLLDAVHLNKELKCDCLLEVMEGEAPCGECVGEILKGEGNPLVAEYYANALYREIGISKEELKRIIAGKYNLPASEQI